MKKPELNKVEVDMVPLIDIISLLLMFLIIVGDTAANASSIQMKLPRASEAKTEKEMKLSTEGRLIVQMKPAEQGKYVAVINNKSYELVGGLMDARGSNKTLIAYLEEQIRDSVARGLATKKDGAVSSPVKLRIPEGAPMQEVEKVIMTLAQVGLVNVQYAAEATFN